MILKRKLLQFNLFNGQYLRRKIHNYETICESNDAKSIGKQAKIQVSKCVKAIIFCKLILI